MGKVVDFIKNNVFWVLMLLAVLIIAAVYLFGVRGLSAQVEADRGKSEQHIKELTTWSSRQTIPKPEMIAEAAAEEKRWAAKYGEQMLLLAARAKAATRDFSVVRKVRDREGKGGEPFGIADATEWWDEYEERCDRRLRRLRDHFDAPDAVFKVAQTPVSPRADLAAARALQREFWRISFVADALIRANPIQKPLIVQLDEVRITGTSGSALKHPWLRTLPLSIKLKMRYENLALLIARLQNSASLLLVHAYTVTLPAPPDASRPGAPAAAPLPEGVVDVALRCELIEPRSVVNTIGFSGPVFKDNEAVRRWVRRQDRALALALLAIAEDVPAVRQRIDMALDGQFDELEQEAVKSLNEARRKIKESAAKTPGEKDAAKTVRPAQGLRQAEQEFIEAMVVHAAKAGGFALAGEALYSYPEFPEKARYVSIAEDRGDGTARLDRLYVLVRAPDDAPHIGGRWWLARYKGAKIYRPRRGKRVTRREVINGLRRTSPGLVEIPIDKTRTLVRKLALFVNPRTKKAERLLVGEPGDRWRTCRMVEYPQRTKAPGSAEPFLAFARQTVSMSDVAFRFAHAVHAAARKIETMGKDATVTTLRITPAAECLPSGRANASKVFEVPLTAGKESKLTIRAGLLKDL